MNKRVISIVMAMLFAISLLSVTALAADPVAISVPSTVKVNSNLNVAITTDGSVHRLIVEIDRDGRPYAIQQIDSVSEKFTHSIYIDDSMRVDNADTLYTITVSDGVGRQASASFTVVKGGGSGSSTGGGDYNWPSQSPGVTPGPSTDPQPTDERVKEFLPDYEWAVPFCLALMDAKVMEGYGNNEFRPGNDVTRAEYAKLIVAGLKLEAGDLEVPDFKDASEAAWAKEYLDIAASNGIILGYEDNEFRPNNKITREELCVITVRALKAVGVTVPDTQIAFADSDAVSAWAKDDVASLATMGIISGVGGNVFDPLSYANRAQAGKIIYGAIVEAFGEDFFE